jgi:hypothetical protein
LVPKATELIRDQHCPAADGLLEAYMHEIHRARAHMLAANLMGLLPKGENVVGYYTPAALRPFSPFGDFLNPSPFSRSIVCFACRTRTGSYSTLWPMYRGAVENHGGSQFMTVHT